MSSISHDGSCAVFCGEPAALNSKSDKLRMNCLILGVFRVIALSIIVLNLSKSLDIQSFKEKNTNGKLKGQVFMFTGKLNNISRAEAKSLIESNGGKIVSNVTKKLDYLVIGEKPTTKKVDLAKKNKIKVINQKTLDEMLN